MKPFLSVLIPCRNEVRSLGRCLASVIASDYPEDRLEVLVLDGASTDGTRDVIAHWARSHERIRMLENPGGTTPAALNRGIAAACGEVIARLDAHAALTPTYLSRAVEYLETTDADQVGGVMQTRAQRDGPWAGALVAALTHPFGVGGSRFRTCRPEPGEEPRWVDTVFCGCWRREVFERVGVFNERLERGQDMEFNQRLRSAGGKILLAPELVVVYYARAELGSFLKHNWTNGVWAVLPFAYARRAPVRARHLAPLTLVLTLLVAPWTLVVYAAASLTASAHVAWIERRWRYLAQMPVAFASLHLPYGVGSLWGVVRLALARAGKKEEDSMSASKVVRAPDFSSVTELPRQGATRMQMSMLRTRYGWAAQYTAGKDVLEVACGAGLGLGWLAQRARRVAAGDVDEKNCRIARDAYRGQVNIRVEQMDALELPFESESFDVALLFEAQYYLEDLPRFLAEAQRVLRPGGALLISTVNCEWGGFHPSFLHTRYWTALELLHALEDAGFATRLCAGFPERAHGGPDLRGILKAVASHLGWIPRSMRAKAILKRIFYGRLDLIPTRLEASALSPREVGESMIPIDQATELARYRTLYFEARRSG